MVLMRQILVLGLFLVLSLTCTPVFSVPDTTMSVTPSASAGTTITASDENTRNSNISTPFNAHSHTDITSTTSNTLTIGNNAAGAKTFAVSDDQSSDPAVRFNTTSDIWTISSDGTTYEAVGLSSGSVIAGENTFRIGDNTGIGNKRLIANENTTDGEIRWLTASDRWEISNDASTYVAIDTASGSFVQTGINDYQIGDGVSSEHKRIVANTANNAGADPMIFFDTNRAVWRFSNSGTTFQDIPTASQSSLGARVFNSANISITNNSESTTTFDSERFDTDSIHSTVSNTGRLTATTAGRYQITGQIEWADGTTGRRQISIRLNGTTYISINESPAAGAGTPSQVVTTLWNMATNDYVELRVFQNSGGALNVVNSGSYTPEFMMQRISE